MQTEAKSVAPPAKPPRLKPNKKQLQFQSPLPGRSRAAAATDAAATKPRRTPAKSKTPTDSSKRNANTDATTAIRNRLAEGCTTLMYACLRGDIVQVLAQMRAKVGAVAPQF